MRKDADEGDSLFNINIPNGDRFSEQFLRDLQEAVFAEDRGFKSSYLREELLSKYCDPTTTPPDVRAAEAIKKWLRTEQRNERTNQRLFWLDATEADYGWVTHLTFIGRVRKIVSRILGPLDYPACFNRAVHTNGASTRVRRSSIAALHKLKGGAHISQSAVTHWLAYLENIAPGRLDHGIHFRESSTLFTVPKNSVIDRVACKEPEINMLLQRAVGGVIRQRLRRVGISLNDQTVNQELARTAVSSGLATIDLSSASDSISSGLVQTLLPGEWWSLLDDLRVKSTIIDGQIHQLEMFSSMGNGFTFELESLLFYAITKACCELSGIEGRISVFGDDIIAPSKIVPRLKSVLARLGFKTNAKKTHYKGWFRESCGKHYHRGVDVSPFFVRGKVSTMLDLIKTLNQAFEWIARGVGFIDDPVFLAFHKKYSNRVPKSLWGGQSIEDTAALVTGHAPRKRLSPVLEEKRRNEERALVHWFMTVESNGRSDTPVVDQLCSRLYDPASRRGFTRLTPAELRWDLPDPIAVLPEVVQGYRTTKNRVERYGIWSPWFLEP